MGFVDGSSAKAVQPGERCRAIAKAGAGRRVTKATLGFASCEAQVKRGLNADARLDETIERFGRGLVADSLARGVIIVDRTSSKTVKEDLANDLQRLRDGLDDNLKDVTTRIQIMAVTRSLPARKVSARCLRPSSRRRVMINPAGPIAYVASRAQAVGVCTRLRDTSCVRFSSIG